MADRDIPQGRSDFYVYILLREDDSPFYVGKGKGQRWRDHLRPSAAKWNPFKAAILRKMAELSVPLRMLKVAEGLTEAQAFSIERETIAAIGRKPIGPLTNLTDGGEGACGFRHTDEFRASVSIRSKRAMAIPGARAAQSAHASRIWGEEGYREAMVKVQSVVQSTPAARIAKRAASTETWIDPQVRQKRIAGLCASLSTPEARALKSAVKLTATARSAQSAVANAQWADPERRAALIAAQNAGKTRSRAAKLMAMQNL